jgi:hypothetical protein
VGKSFAPMEDQVPPSQSPEFLPITREQLDEMKSRARELAIQQTLAQQGAMPQPQPQVIYVRRNFTVAELLLIIVVSCGIVTGIQWTWNVVTDILPRIEIRAK